MDIQTYLIAREILVNLLLGLFVIFVLASIFVMLGISIEVSRGWKTFFKGETYSINSFFNKEVIKELIKKPESRSKLMPIILWVRKRLFVLLGIMFIDGVLLIIFDMIYKKHN